MLIEIDNDSGFCFGVKKAIELAEKSLEKGEPVYCLGEIVHNKEEVKRLESKGLRIVDHSGLSKISDSMVLVRAHGEPPSTFSNIEKNKNQLYDGTCPIVLGLQKKVRKAWEEVSKEGGKVVIFGKKGHAEVNGLAGQTNNEAIVISNLDDIRHIDLTKPVVLFSQTTMSREDYQEISAKIKQGMQEKLGKADIPFQIHNTICGHVANRGEKLKTFSANYNVIVFVSGLNSSNGKVLYNICKDANVNTYWIADSESIRKEWFDGAQKVGICGATSTPRWLMEEVAVKIKELLKI
jgi:4-hydroxy-3-methylbut-2-enyl diphosphate reductase